VNSKFLNKSIPMPMVSIHSTYSKREIYSRICCYIPFIKTFSSLH